MPICLTCKQQFNVEEGHICELTEEQLQEIREDMGDELDYPIMPEEWMIGEMVDYDAIIKQAEEKVAEVHAKDPAYKLEVLKIFLRSMLKAADENVPIIEREIADLTAGEVAEEMMIILSEPEFYGES